MYFGTLYLIKIKDRLKPNNPYKVNAELYCKLHELATIRDVRAGGKFTVKSNLLILISELQFFFKSLLCTDQRKHLIKMICVKVQKLHNKKLHIWAMYSYSFSWITKHKKLKFSCSTVEYQIFLHILATHIHG